MSDDIFTFVDIPIRNVTKEQAVTLIQSHLEDDRCNEIHFVNAHCINVAVKDDQYRSILADAAAVFPDGTGIRKAGDALGHPIVDNVNGTDLFPMICDMCKKSGKTIYLLGGKPSIAGKCAKWVEDNIGSSVIGGCHDGYFTAEEAVDVIDDINAASCDILLVGMGVPSQEKWIHEHLDSLEVSVAMGVGGLFDYYSGTIPRAPLLMRKMGIEWVWRLMMEPRRMWRRYIIGNALFLLRLKQIQREQKKDRTTA
ncbi:MAG: WecB/TagA/CpsF family glycosyltransferase [Sphaerochaetaceae bacterium]|nr:WecB/TagA/CpsF family glycosyltransferase [Sphaerochaetaceae bacterium]